MSIRVVRFGLAVCAISVMMSLGACGGGGDSSLATPLPPPVVPVPDPWFRASGDSPFPANCNGAPQIGTLYTGAEVEPYVAANPRNPANLIGVWQQDRWSSGGSQGLVTGVSMDGGKTWARRALPFSRCGGGNAANGGDFERASDPWVSFGPDGVAYQISLSFSGQTQQPGSASAMLASRSTDGGLNWSNPAVLIRDSDQFFNDKGTISADPTDARFVYAVWDRLDNTGRGPAMLARSTDGGLTWEAARPIFDPGSSSQTIGNEVVVLPSGVVIDFFTRLDVAAGGTVSASLALIRSSDRGVTWSAPVMVADLLAIGVRDPDTGTQVRDGSILGQIAAGSNGNLAVVWQDARFNGGLRDGIALSRSLDGGLTWSSPVRVNRDPTVQAFTPSVAQRADGTLGIAYYDLRSNTSSTATLLADYWLARTTDGVAFRESRIGTSFDLALAPNAEGLFLGDYQALASIGATWVPFFAATINGDAGNRTDVYAALVTSEGSAAAAAAGKQALAGAGRESAFGPASTAMTADPALARDVSRNLAWQLRQRHALRDPAILRRTRHLPAP